MMLSLFPLLTPPSMRWGLLYRSEDGDHPVYAAPGARPRPAPGILDGDLASDPDGRMVADTVGRSAALYDPRTGRWTTLDLRRVVGPEPALGDEQRQWFGVCPDPDRNRLVVSVGAKRTVVAVDLRGRVVGPPLVTPRALRRVPLPPRTPIGPFFHNARISPDGRLVAVSFPGLAYEGEGPERVPQTWLVDVRTQRAWKVGDADPIGWTAPDRLLLWRSRGGSGVASLIAPDGRAVWRRAFADVAPLAGRGVVAFAYASGDALASLALFDAATGRRRLGRIAIQPPMSRGWGSAALVRDGGG